MMRPDNYKKHLWFVGALVGAFITIICLGCEDKQAQSYKVVNPKSDYTYVEFGDYAGVSIKTVEYEGCEYIISYCSARNVIIHKQNCKFCAERNKNEALHRTSPK